MIAELAEFEKMSHLNHMNKDILLRDGFKTSPPLFFALIPEIETSQNMWTPVGYALFIIGFSLRWGHYVYLEDLYVQQQFRGQGIGRDLFTKVATNSRDVHGCKSMHWTVVDWNERARKFYEKFGSHEVENSIRYRFADGHPFLQFGEIDT